MSELVPDTKVEIPVKHVDEITLSPTRLVGGIVAVLVMWWGLSGAALLIWPSWKLSFAQAGDAFAPFAGAIAAAGLYSVYQSFRLQHREFALARDAFLEQGKELKASADALTKQLENMEEQRDALVQANVIADAQAKATKRQNEIARLQTRLNAHELLEGATSKRGSLIEGARVTFLTEIRTIGVNDPENLVQWIAVEKVIESGTRAELDAELATHTSKLDRPRRESVRRAAHRAMDAVVFERDCAAVVRDDRI